MISNHAAAAKAIRTELKKHGIKGSVRSESYSGGSSIRVYLTDELPATVEAIEAFANQYQYGSFDGMTDSYNYDNKRDDLPQVSFVFVETEYSDEMKNAAWAYGRSYFADLADAPESREEGANEMFGNEWGMSWTHQILSGYRDTRFWTSRKPRVAA